MLRINQGSRGRVAVWLRGQCSPKSGRHRVIAFEELFYGTVDGSAVQPREVVKRALAHNAAALVVAHNHPSGITNPSQADETITKRLKEPCELMGIRLLDHVVVGEGKPFHFAEKGLL